MRRSLTVIAASLAISAAASGLVLAGLALQTLQVDCQGAGEAECVFERAAARKVAQLQSVTALALWLVAAGGWLGLRRRAP